MTRSAAIGLAVALALALAGARGEAASAHGTAAPVVVSSEAVLAAAIGSGYIVWESGSLESAYTPVELLQKDLRTGRVRIVASGVSPLEGVAVTARWIVYVDGRGRLIAAAHDGSRRRVLSNEVTAPIASAGGQVAWLEAGPTRQRLVVRDVDTGRTLVTKSYPRCTRCLRLAAVELAPGLVVYTRDGTSPDRSIVARVRIGTGAQSEVHLTGDPQPDLAPSTAGALYNVFARGWYRWDAGARRPLRTPFGATPPVQVLGYVHGIWLLEARQGCRPSIVAVIGGRRQTVTPAREVAPDRQRCVVLQGVQWSGNTLLSAWATEPAVAFEQHADVDLAGRVLTTPLPRVTR